MPILAPEPMIFPPDLLQQAVEPAGDAPSDASAAGDAMKSARWWALHTLPRQEKELMRQLRSLGIAHYCPLVKNRTKSPSGRVRTSYLPLFSGYVFSVGSDEQRHQALATHCVVKTLEVPDAARLVFDLQQIQRLIELDAPLTIEAKIQPGQRVRVRSGPMQNLEGIVVKRRGKSMLVVSLAFLNQGASVLLEDFHLERID